MRAAAFLITIVIEPSGRLLTRCATRRDRMRNWRTLFGSSTDEGTPEEPRFPVSNIETDDDRCWVSTGLFPQVVILGSEKGDIQNLQQISVSSGDSARSCPLLPARHHSLPSPARSCPLLRRGAPGCKLRGCTRARSPRPAGGGVQGAVAVLARGWLGASGGA